MTLATSSGAGFRRPGKTCGALYFVGHGPDKLLGPVAGQGVVACIGFPQ